MATKTIRIVIKEMEQDGEKYYLARSSDLPWLIVEADTLQEMLDIAPMVAEDLIDLNNKTMNEHHLNRTFLRDFTYQFIYEPMVVRHLEYA